jgi:uncharacterized protein (TIGR02118 family)
MVKVTILFGRPTDEVAFQKHFNEVHVPAGAKVPGVARIETGKLDTVFSSEPNPNLYWVVDLWFENEEELEKALKTPEAQAAIEDLASFATGGVTVVTSVVHEELAVRAGPVA